MNAGQTPTTAIPVGVGARAGDEGAGEVTATGAQTAGPGKTPDINSVPPQPSLFSFLWLNVTCSASLYASKTDISPSSAGRTAPPVAVLPGAGVTAAAVATAELSKSAEREENHRVRTLSNTQQQSLLSSQTRN